jgi:DNA-binding transcriptional ArsR family regulator
MRLRSLPEADDPAPTRATTQLSRARKIPLDTRREGHSSGSMAHRAPSRSATASWSCSRSRWRSWRWSDIGKGVFEAARSAGRRAYRSARTAEHLNELSFVRMSHGVDGQSDAAGMDLELARAVAEQMQVLSTPSRVMILARLKAGSCAVGELADAISMEPSAVSQQLRTLRHLGLVVGERHGKQIVYGLHDAHVAELLDQAVFHVEHIRLGDRQPIAAEAQRA